MSTTLAPNPLALPYLHARGDGGPRVRTQLLVIHFTDNPNGASAHDEAQWASRNPDETSAHAYIDASAPWQTLPWSHVAYGCYPRGNAISVQLELCTRSGTQPDDAVIRKAAPIAAALCEMYGLPVQKVTPAQINTGVKGICGHYDITRAFGQGDHTDAGPDFAWSRFISLTRLAQLPTERPKPPAWPGRLLMWPAPRMLHGSDVLTVQTRLRAHGFGLAADSWYGPKTRDAVVAFQKRVRISPDGVVGPITWSKLWTA